MTPSGGRVVLYFAHVGAAAGGRHQQLRTATNNSAGAWPEQAAGTSVGAAREFRPAQPGG
eukprot:8466598-Alexandrium_andersonii.AAC.1